ncbi:MAG: hypothetical protein DRG33_03405 [Deltaproteobacteria bacterium]|nr:MAG: hypothetical protein DRG33_03405 [Deltaproteobacteria bacterium]
MRFNYDRLIALILFLFSVALYFFIIPWGVEGAGEGGTGLSPDFMPRWIAVALASLSLLHFFVARGEGKGVRLFHQRVLISIALFVLYIAITPLLGYLVASVLIMAVYLLHFGVRRWHTVVLLSILFPVVLYLFFAKVMLVVLPKGSLFY